jgi:hypothetical protein
MPRSSKAFQGRLLGGCFVKMIGLGIELRCEPLDIFVRDTFFLALKAHANSDRRTIRPRTFSIVDLLHYSNSGQSNAREREASVYASIRQGKAKAGMAEELTRRIKEGAIPIISDVDGFMGYYVVYAPDDTVTAISIFKDFAGAEESNRRALAWIEQSLAPLLVGPATAIAGPVIVHTLA